MKQGGVDQGRSLQQGMRALFGAVEVISVLIVVVATWLYIFEKTPLVEF